MGYKLCPTDFSIRGSNIYEVLGKVTFSQLCVISSVYWDWGWWLPSIHHRSHDRGGGLHRGWGGGLARSSPKIHGILQDTFNKREVRILVKFKIGPFQDKYKTIHEGRFSVWHRSIINHLFVFPPKIN